MFDVRMDADMIVINRRKSAPGWINFSYELLSQTQIRPLERYIDDDRHMIDAKCVFVRFNLEFILKRDMRSVN